MAANDNRRDNAAGFRTSTIHHRISSATNTWIQSTLYANAHWKELIDKYDAAILWNDICYPRGTDVNSLLAYFYNSRPDGVANDRFAQYRADGSIDKVYHSDINTPKYKIFEEVQEKKWESCPGIGHSFGSQQQGRDRSSTFRVRSSCVPSSISSPRAANLLLNVGPKADGTIPGIQEERLRSFGRLDQYGEGFFGTCPVPGRLLGGGRKLPDITADGTELRFTKNDNTLFIILMCTPGVEELLFPDLVLKKHPSFEIVGLPNKERRRFE